MRSAAWGKRVHVICACVRQVSALAATPAREKWRFSSPYRSLKEKCRGKKIAVCRASGLLREPKLGVRKYVYDVHVYAKRRYASCCVRVACKNGLVFGTILIIER